MTFPVNNNIKSVDITEIIVSFGKDEEAKKAEEQKQQQEEEKALFEEIDEIRGKDSKDGADNTISDIETALEELDKHELEKTKKSNASVGKKRLELNIELKNAEFKEDEKKNIIVSKIKEDFVNDKVTVGNIAVQIGELHNETQRREIKAILNEMRHIKEHEDGSLELAASKLDLVQ